MTWLIALGTPLTSLSVLLKSSIWCLTVPALERFHLALRTTYFSGEHLGGTFIFALMSHAQIRNDMSKSAKQKHAKKQNVRKTLRKMKKPGINGEGLSNRAAAYLPRVH